MLGDGPILGKLQNCSLDGVIPDPRKDGRFHLRWPEDGYTGGRPGSQGESNYVRRVQMEMFDQSNHVAGHGPIRIESDFPRFRGSTEAAEIRENHPRVRGEERWENSRAPFGGRIGKGRSSAKRFDEKFLSCFKERQNPFETPKLPKSIDSIAMQKNDRRTSALVMVGDRGAIEGSEVFHRRLQRMH